MSILQRRVATLRSAESRFIARDNPEMKEGRRRRLWAMHALRAPLPSREEPDM